MPKRLGRRPKRFSQAARLIRMIRMLGSRPMTTKELAQEFGIEPRQVYRDRQYIEESGIPLISDETEGEKSWRIAPSYRWMPPDPPTASELMSLYLAKNAVAYLNGTPFMNDLETLSKKIEATLPAKTANHLERIVRVFLPRQRPHRFYDKQVSVLCALQKALLLQRPVTIQHRAGGYDQPVTHRVDPYGLVLYESGLYLTGYSHREKDARTFAVERIAKATVDMEAGPVTIPPNALDPQAFGRAFGLIIGPVMKVRIRFKSDVAHLLRERQWHPTQRNTELANGDILVTFEAGGLDEMTSWILAWGSQAHVLSPPALIMKVKQQLEEARKLYREAKSRATT
jgi:predicted DNA-binding transcriptional regulator YafY